MPNSSSTPNELHRFSVRPVSQSVSSANGIDIGRLIMMASGCSRLSNCAASTMYMKMHARRKAMIRLLLVSSRVFTVPENRLVYPGGKPTFLIASRTFSAAAPRAMSDSRFARTAT